VDDSLSQTGVVENVILTIDPHLANNGTITETIPGGNWDPNYPDWIDVPPGAVNLIITVTNLTGTAFDPGVTQQAVDLYVKFGSPPTLTSYDTNVVINPGTPATNSILIPSPLVGRYYFGVFNPSATPQTVSITADYSLPSVPAQMYFTSAGPVPILDDAVMDDFIPVSDNATIYSVDVGLCVDHPRISDLVFHLISPDGTRVLLMENRGGTTTNGMGGTVAVSTIPLIPLVTNSFYLVLTENTNLTTTPIKFAPPPFATTNDLFYLPEQSLDAFAGKNAQGMWTLEVQDDRAGASNNATLVSWQLRFIFTTPVVPPPVLPPSLLPTTSLHTARGGHTATLLNNGQVLVAGGGNSSGILSSAELYDPASGTWTMTGPMNNPRTQHTATLLTNGLVLVAGGITTGNGTYLSSAELYDPASGMWTPTGKMTYACWNPTATLLTNGQVLVAGGIGISGNPATNAELYDPTLGTWKATGPMHTPRVWDPATLLANGQVLIIGGYGGPGTGVNEIVTNAELYDPTLGTWTLTTSLPINARVEHVATLLPNGLVLVAGGYNTNNTYLTNSELYDPTLGTWTPTTGSMQSGHGGATATLLPNGHVLVAGGNIGSGGSLSIAELYDPTLGTWTPTSSLHTPRYSHTATLLANGKVLVVGGYGSGIALNSAELYDSASGTWEPTYLLHTPRYIHTATLLTNGLVLVAGGVDNAGNILNSAELYNPDPVSGGWTGAGSMTDAARYAHTATLLPNGKVLVVGGYGNSGAALSSAELYDPVSGWEPPTGSMAAARYFHTATLLPNGKVLVVGGYGSSGALRSAELYDPVSGWATTGSMTNARYFHTATLLPNGLVLVAAGYGNNGILSSAELYDPVKGTWMTTGSLNTPRYIYTATLLFNGQVLIAGGYGGAGSYLSSAELYDPASGVWTPTGSLNTARYIHTATLLLNGKVLVAGGDNANSILPDAELYDPVKGTNGTWTATSSLTTPRASPTATLLPNGKVLVTGGYGGSGNSGVLQSAELYDVGLGFSPAWQPLIATFNSPINFGDSLMLTGSQFRGVSEGSGGNSSQNSPADYPVVQLRSVESGQTLFLLATNWSVNSFASVPVTLFPPGYALVTMFVNGIPSASSIPNILLIGSMPTATILTTGSQPQTSSIQPGGIVYYAVLVPPYASYATNILVSATAPVNVWFNQNGLPTGMNSPGDFLLITNAPGTSVLSTNSVPLLLPGRTYYIGVQNTNSGAVTAVFEVDFGMITGSFSANVTSGGAQLQWTAPSDARFQMEWATNLSQPMVWMTNDAIITSSDGTFTFTDPGATNSPMRFYRLLQLP
jgi:subtilisin-like proprotein convertase family protein